MEYIRLASDLTFDSVVDGSGIRTVIWTQGCPHNCKGCHNPETHDFYGGKLVLIDEVIKRILDANKNVCFSGGDPFVQAKECYLIAKKIKEHSLNIWAYSGWEYEALIEKSKIDENILLFLKNIDVLVDGPFILSERNLDLKFRGSNNQRIIDVQKSLKENKVILWKDSFEFIANDYPGVFI